MNRTHEKIPRSGPQREALREKGQFWTPDWIAEAMVRYVEPDVSRELFDPAFGAGAFFLAAKRLLRDLSQIDLQANEIDASSLQKATANGLSPHEIQNVKIRNFLLTPPTRKFKSIVANPPYIRHHRIPLQVKIRLKALSQAITGNKLDGRAGLHIFFLIQALGLLAEGGRLAFILPGDTFEGVFAQELWYWIARHFRIDAVITFASAAAPFPGVDTNAVVIFITNRSPKSELKWGRCTQPNTANLGQWINSGMNTDSLFPGEIYQRDLDEALETGLSRPPVRERQGISLVHFATVIRGIATGANQFFFFTKKRARELRISESYFVRAIGRTRDIAGDLVTQEDLDRLDEAGRPTFLLNLRGGSAESLPLTVQNYLRFGESQGLPKRPLIATRKPWYRMESRRVPPLLFAYLGRRNARFIRNLAGAVPLTGFLCVYPRSTFENYTDRLLRVLNHPATLENLLFVAKSYGSGAIKVEPRALERLLIPEVALRDAELQYQHISGDQLPLRLSAV